MKQLLLLIITASFMNMGNAQQLNRQQAISFATGQLTIAKKEHQERAVDDWKDSIIRRGALPMKFHYRLFGNAPFGERSMYISLHGGGNAAPRVNDQQWNNQKRLYTPAEGLYFVPRAPTNTWNLWHENHIDDLFETVIKDAITLHGVSANKIYLLGYSAGGDGLFQLAPRMADHWAAASMMAGHPGDASALPLRNLPFAIFMGGKDAAYDRNKHAASWKILLDSLQKSSPGNYIHQVHIYEDKGHWMERQDTIALSWMAQFSRKSLPEKVSWVQDDRLRYQFYWLGTDTLTKAGEQAIVHIDKPTNTIVLEKNSFNTLDILLNDDMLNLNKPVKVVYEGRRIFKGKLKRRRELIEHSIRERLDAQMIFFSGIRVKGNMAQAL